MASPAPPINYNDTTPAPPAAMANVVWQYDAAGNVSAHFPPASATQLGGVKQGSGVLIASDGTLSASINSNVRIVTTDATTMNTTDFLVILQGSSVYSITLPLTPSAGQIIEVNNLATGTITVNAGAGQTIQAWGGTVVTSATSVTIAAGASIALCYSTSIWYVTGVAAQQAGASGYNATVAPATSTVLGSIKQGAGVVVATDGTLSVAPATASVIGGVKQGAGVTITSDGTLNVTATGSGPMVPATPTTLGGVIVGSALSVQSNGTLSVNAGAGLTVLGNGALSTIVEASRSSDSGTTTLSNDQVIYAYANISLLATPVTGQTVTIFNATTTSLNILAGGSQTINGWNGTNYLSGLGSITLAPGAAVTMIAYDSTVWLVIGNNGTATSIGYAPGVAPATAGVAGVVKPGTGLTVAADGTLSATPSFTWQSWTPTVSPFNVTLANVSVSPAKYMQIGNLVFVMFYLQFDVTNAGSGGAEIDVSLPIVSTVQDQSAALYSSANPSNTGLAIGRIFTNSISCYPTNTIEGSFVVGSLYHIYGNFWYSIS